VDKYGFVSPDAVNAAIRKDTILVSIMHANNEIGTIEPIKKIGKICNEADVPFHTDAAQSFGKLPIDVDKMNIDMLTASSHKMYGPLGIAALYVRKGIKLEPLLHGGGQEQDLRSSTVNVAGAVGFGKAVEIAKKEMKKEERVQTKLRDRLIKDVLDKIEDSHLNGHPKKRLPNNANFWFSYIEGESLIMRLNVVGIAAGTGSACSSLRLEPSHVLLAIGLKPEEAHGSLRLSMGRFTKKSDIDYVIKTLPKIVKDLRRISPFKKSWKA
jgi:cysteine desulfurase